MTKHQCEAGENQYSSRALLGKRNDAGVGLQQEKAGMGDPIGKRFAGSTVHVTGPPNRLDADSRPCAHLRPASSRAIRALRSTLPFALRGRRSMG